MTFVENDLQKTIDTLLENFKELPENEKIRRNVFEIAGFPRRETVNSNMLAFYFDKKEEHGFGTLFLESLLEKIKVHPELSETNYEVYREYQFIDILIAAKSTSENKNNANTFDWAIIIENKIFHDLDNNLKEYWDRVTVRKGGTKIGIIISPFGYNESERQIFRKKKNGEKELITTYHDVTHKQLTETVQQNISNIYLEADDHHLLLLKDYINNINSININQEEIMNQEIKLSTFQKNAKAIKDIIKLNDEVRLYVMRQIIEKMEKFGYKPNSTYYSATGKHFYKEENKANDDNQREIPPYFRFFAWYESLVESKELNFHFELFGKYVKYGDALHEDKNLKTLLSGERYRFAKLVNKKGKGYHHLIHYKDSTFGGFNEEKILHEYFYKVMDEVFFNEETGLLWKVTERLESIIAKEKIVIND